MADLEGDLMFARNVDEAEVARLDAKAEAEIDPGRFVPHADVAKWLQSWGTPNKLPRPKSSAR